MTDEFYMQQAMREARKAFDEGEFRRRGVL